MKNLSITKKLCRAAVIAALYAAITWVLGSFAFGPFQIRPAEALTLLPLFFPEAVPALYVGCVLANLLSGYGLYDIFLGSLATLIAALATYAVGKFVKNNILKICIGGFFPVIFNAVIIPFVIYLASGEVAYWATFFSLFLTQSVWIYGLGTPMYFALLKLIKKGVIKTDFKIDGKRQKFKKTT